MIDYRPIKFKDERGDLICQCRLWVEIEAHKWRDLELNLSKTVEELRQDSQLIQANSMKKLRDNKKLLECSFAQIQFQITSLDFRWRLDPQLIVSMDVSKFYCSSPTFILGPTFIFLPNFPGHTFIPWSLEKMF